LHHIWAKLLQFARLCVIVENHSVRLIQSGCHWGVQQLHRVLLTHRARDAETDFSQRAPIEASLQVPYCITPDEHMNSCFWTVTEYRHKLLRRLRRGICAQPKVKLIGGA
jgi:hypothetical protein